MAVDVKLWSAIFSQTSIPSWPCPRCNHGRLSITDKSLKVMEPAHSEAAHSHEAWDPEWVVERFIAVMKCSDPKCGELVMIAGDTDIEQEEDEEFGYTYVSYLRPRAIFPPPPIIALPEETPDHVRTEVELAFQLFWSDLGASANRLRTSVERLLDDFGIAKTRIDTNQKKRVFRSLASRIDLFKKQQPAYGDSLDALRHVGNLGTHSDVSRQAVLAGFAIYEDALAEIYGKRSKKVAALAKKIIRGKGELK